MPVNYKMHLGGLGEWPTTTGKQRLDPLFKCSLRRHSTQPGGLRLKLWDQSGQSYTPAQAHTSAMSLDEPPHLLKSQAPLV